MKLKKFTAIFLLICIVFSAHSSLALSLSAEGACLLDFETNEIIYEKNPDALLTPASLTKVMTLFLLFEGLERNDYTKDTLIPVSENAAILSKNTEATNVVFSPNDFYSIDELINMIVSVSACAACTVFAEYISGSEAEFAALMTKRAEELGLTAYFEDASGLSDKNYVTPRTMALLVNLFIKKYPDILNYTSKPQMTLRGKKYDNTNFLLPGKKFFYSGVDGFKTGSTSLAGKCLVATAQQGGERIISVNMKSRTNDLRYSDATKLLDYGFNHINYYNSSIFSTDIKTFVNGLEIPCFYFHGQKKALLIVAENLNGYGFCTDYDPKCQTLYIYECAEKSFQQVPVTSFSPGQKLFSIYKDFTPNVVLIKDGVQHKLNTVYSLNGQCLIDVDELKNYYPYTWNDSLRTASLGIR